MFISFYLVPDSGVIIGKFNSHKIKTRNPDQFIQYCLGDIAVKLNMFQDDIYCFDELPIDCS